MISAGRGRAEPCHASGQVAADMPHLQAHQAHAKDRLINALDLCSDTAPDRTVELHSTCCTATCCPCRYIAHCHLRSSAAVLCVVQRVAVSAQQGVLACSKALNIRTYIPVLGWDVYDLHTIASSADQDAALIHNPLDSLVSWQIPRTCTSGHTDHNHGLYAMVIYTGASSAYQDAALIHNFLGHSEGTC